MNGVFIIPTGIGCSIGGHAGDAVCAVNLIASQCENLIVNPNAINASDINEMAPNCLYVEGSIIDEFLRGETGLMKSRRNKILLAVNPPIHPQTVNSVNAAIVSLGVDIEIVELKTPLVMKAGFEPDGSAGGEVTGWEELLRQTRGHRFDALAIQSEIDAPKDVVSHYLAHGGVNPWGGVEAKASRLIAHRLRKPVAHAPFEPDDSPFKRFAEVVNPRLSAEIVSVSFIHCVLKGLARAPLLRTSPGASLYCTDMDFLVTPDDCFGAPHKACRQRGIEVIVVRENKSVLNNAFPSDCTFVDNYLEAAGLLACRKIGIGEQSVRADGRGTL